MRRADYFLANCAQGAVAIASPVLNFDPSLEKWRHRWNACRRWRRYSLYGCTLTVVGLALMYLMVTHLGINVLLAQMIAVPAIMAVISYIVHRFKTFGDRDVSNHSGRRFTVVRLGGMGISKISFLLLVSVLGVQYLFASALITAALSWPTYRLNRDWAFKPVPAYTPDVIRGQLGATLPIIR